MGCARRPRRRRCRSRRRGPHVPPPRPVHSWCPAAAAGTGPPPLEELEQWRRRRRGRRGRRGVVGRCRRPPIPEGLEDCARHVITHIIDPSFLSYTAAYDVASIIRQALPSLLIHNLGPGRRVIQRRGHCDCSGGRGEECADVVDVDLAALGQHHGGGGGLRSAGRWRQCHRAHRAEPRCSGAS